MFSPARLAFLEAGGGRQVYVVEDGLASNGPHIRDLLDCGMHFILGVKPGDHAFLFEQVEAVRVAAVERFGAR